MKILCDEHVPPAIVNALDSEGFTVVTVADELESGTADADLLRFAADQGYVVLTNDSDFVDRIDHAGVLYYDDQSLSHRELLRAVRRVDDVLDEEHRRDRTVFLPDGWI